MLRRIGYCSCILALILVLGLLARREGGLAHFSPHTLEYTIQSEVAVAGLTIFRSARQPVGNELVDFLVAEGFVAPEQPQTQRWESVFHWNEAWRDGHGALYPILCRDRQALVEWSKADPPLARLYWAEVFRLLRSDRKADHVAAYVLAQRWRECETVPAFRELLGKAKEEGEVLYPQP